MRIGLIVLLSLTLAPLLHGCKEEPPAQESVEARDEAARERGRRMREMEKERAEQPRRTGPVTMPFGGSTTRP